MDCAVSQGLVLCPLNIGARRKNGSLEWQVSIGLMFCPTPCHANSRTSMIRPIPSFFYGVVAYAVLFSTVSLLYPICLLTHLVLDVRVSVRVPEPVLLYFPYCIHTSYIFSRNFFAHAVLCLHSPLLANLPAAAAAAVVYVPLFSSPAVRCVSQWPPARNEGFPQQKPR